MSIRGYRTLSQDELSMINEHKEVEASLLRMLSATRAALNDQLRDARTSTEVARINAAEPQRWVSMARTHFQQGFMCLNRAVAQPGEE